MAFSLGIVSYTISTLVGAIEEIAEEILDREDDTSILEKAVIPEPIAEEIFDSIGQKGIEVPPPEIADEPVIGAPVVGELPESPTIEVKGAKQVLAASRPVYEDVTVTKYYLRYSYDLDDIPNTRLRSDFARNAARVFQRSTAEMNRLQADVETESKRLREERERTDLRNRERRVDNQRR